MSAEYEPILDVEKYPVYFGVKIPELEQLCEKQEHSRWTESELNFTDDINNWSKLSADEQHFIKYVLSFSVVSDHLVNDNLLDRFTSEVADPSARRFYLFQAYMENIHARSYGMMLTAVVKDKDELYRLTTPDINIPSIKMKIDFIEKWTNSDRPFAERLVAFAIIEGIFFSSLFCSFYWLRNKGSLLSGMIQANEFISRDEGMHCEFAQILLQYLNYKPCEDTVTTMVREAVAVEHNFVNESLPADLIGINKVLMCEYVEFVADRLLTGIATKGHPKFNKDTGAKLTSHMTFCKKIYNTKLPMPWMETISLQHLSNFFDKNVTNYVDSKLGKTMADNEYSTDIDF